MTDHEVRNIANGWRPDVADALLRSGTTRDEPFQGHRDRNGGLGTGPSGPYAGYAGLHRAIKGRGDDTAGELLQSALHLRTAYVGITGVDHHADQDLGAQTRSLGLTPLG